MKTVCIDAGHGGKDSGAVGPGGVMEKNVALIVAHLLKAALIGTVNVVMTRTDDSFVELGERAAFANEKGADLFLSIHCNSAERPARGIETFIHRNTAVGFPLGESLQDAMMAEFPDHVDRGLKRSEFAVLRLTKMPAALVELEFIHVASGEAHLSDPKVQVRCAKALARGVRKFLGLGDGPSLPAGPEESAPCPAIKMADRIRVLAAQLVEVAKMTEP